jgi:hypothetical protein
MLRETSPRFRELRRNFSQEPLPAATGAADRVVTTALKSSENKLPGMIPFLWAGGKALLQVTTLK